MHKIAMNVGEWDIKFMCSSRCSLVWCGGSVGIDGAVPEKVDAFLKGGLVLA
jgi:hypothetical protein